MTVSTQEATVIVKPISGDYRIDVLVEDSSYRWNSPGALQSTATVTYSFMTAAPTYAAAEDAKGFTPFTADQMAATAKILTRISDNFNINFSQVSDSPTSYGQLRFGNNQQGETSAGYAFVPDATTGDQAGDLYLNNETTDNLSNVAPGTYAYATLVHEIGHTLGLKHPGNYNAGEAASAVPGNYLVKTEDSTANTIMSYVDAAGGQQRDFFGRYDFLALQYFYGSRNVNTGDTTYTYKDIDGRMLQTINDSGGTDTVDVSAATLPASIDLRDGAFSSVGSLADGTAARDNVSLAYGTVIEDVIGTALADTIVGNALANRLTGGAGNDTIDGGAGLDTAVFSGAIASFSVQQTVTGYTVISTEGTDTWVSVERAQFADKKLAFDMDGSAGNAAKLIGAALGAEFLKPAYDSIKGAVIGILDGGTTLKQLAANVVGLDPFIQMAGSNNDTDFVKLIYRNVIGGEATPEVASSLVTFMTDNKFSQGDFLATVADLQLNVLNINLIGLAATGLEYV